jgi:hypothetical protein
MRDRQYSQDQVAAIFERASQVERSAANAERGALSSGKLPDLG